MPKLNDTKPSLLRALSLTDATALVVGTVIGSGIFLKTTVMAQQLNSPALVLLAWLAAGLLSLAGALSYAELGAMFPQAGGEFVYLRKAYGDAPAFLFGWTQFAVVSAGGIAGISAGFAIFLSALIPLGGPWIERTFHLLGQDVHWQFGLTQIVAVAAIALFAAINCLGIVVGSRIQTLLTAAKIIGIAVIVFGVFFFSRTADWSHLQSAAGASSSGSLSAFGAAMMAALWAYNGWYMLPVIAGEVIEPQRNVPRGLIAGTLILLLIYLSANLAYFYALPLSEIITSNSTTYRDALPVAAKAAQTFLGPTGTTFISLAFVISTLGALNGGILSLARIPYAMARDGLFFQSLGDVHPTSRAPIKAILAQSAWASVLALSGSFDQITTCAIFAMWLFFGVTVSAVFTLRHKQPDIARPYKTLGYPFVPLLFIAVAAWLVVNTIVTSPVESGVGLILIALGLPIYFYFKRNKM
ncbi:MAG: amino acid permease [Acidobacteria bacterium]|nr:amino acid permease [Acidobacteriota bacterium]